MMRYFVLVVFVGAFIGIIVCHAIKKTPYHPYASREKEIRK
jgi:hypothetical protein